MNNRKNAGITMLVASLVHREGEIGFEDVRGQLDVPASTLSRCVARLEAQGVVVVAPNPLDGRLRILRAGANDPKSLVVESGCNRSALVLAQHESQAT